MYAAGDILTADELNTWLPIRVVKPTLLGRNTTITPTADNHLFVPLLASKSYDFRVLLMLSSAANAAGDFRGRMAWPASCSCSYSGLGLVTAIASGGSADLIASPTTRLDTTSPGLDWLTGCSTSGMLAVLFGTIDVGATPGNLTLEWAQRVSNANNTNVLEGSEIIAWRTA